MSDTKSQIQQLKKEISKLKQENVLLGRALRAYESITAMANNQILIDRKLQSIMKDQEGMMKMIAKATQEKKETGDNL